jgi:hypothetical protein
MLLLFQCHALKQQREQQLRAAAAAAAWGLYPCEARQTSGFGAPPCLNSSASPPLLKPPASAAGMRAMFLTPPGAKRECAGTGVFIPRQAPAQAKKKPGPGTPSACFLISFSAGFFFVKILFDSASIQLAPQYCSRLASCRRSILTSGTSVLVRCTPAVSSLIAVIIFCHDKEY